MTDRSHREGYSVAYEERMCYHMTTSKSR